MKRTYTGHDDYDVLQGSCFNEMMVGMVVHLFVVRPQSVFLDTLTLRRQNWLVKVKVKVKLKVKVKVKHIVSISELSFVLISCN